MKVIVRKARRLRREMTRTECMLWTRLRKRQLNGHRFRRQHPLGDFIADFACLSEGLLIEIDGPAHEGRDEKDGRRERMLKARGYRLMRFQHWELEIGLNDVVDAIARELGTGE